MTRFKYVFAFAVVSLLSVIGIAGLEASPSRDVVNKDVVIIKVTENTKYVVDKKHNLCFYENATDYLVTSIPIPCSSFVELF